MGDGVLPYVGAVTTQVSCWPPPAMELPDIRIRDLEMSA